MTSLTHVITPTFTITKTYLEMVNDRTFEFRSTIDIISGGQTALHGSSGNFSNLKTNQFLEKATAITSELSKNSLKLEQLTKRKAFN